MIRKGVTISSMLPLKKINFLQENNFENNFPMKYFEFHTGLKDMNFDNRI